MSSLYINKEISELIDSYKEFVNNLEKKYNNIDIKKTKIFKYKNLLENLDHLHENEKINLLRLINKYAIINGLFSENTSLKYTDEHIIKIIDGQSITNDQEEKYNDTFFEISMAVRFDKSFQKKPDEKHSIDMCDVCDIIIDREIAIECKYLRSSKQIEKRIKKAISQIEERITQKKASYGIIALDISNLVDSEKIEKFTDEIFAYFLENTNEIIDSCSFLKEALKDRINSIIENDHFMKIIHTYIGHEMETTLYKQITENTKIKFENNVAVRAIIFQANVIIPFRDGENIIAVNSRAMSYLINSSLQEHQKEEMQIILHSLLVGF